MKVVSSLILSLLFGAFVKSNVLSKKEGIQTLVLIDDYSIIETHSILFDSMRRDGHVLQFEMVTAQTPAIKYYEDYYHDNIILMAPSVRGIKDSFLVNNLNIELKDPVTNKELLEFV